MTDFKKLKVVELRAELAARNLSETGKKDELIERLEEYEFHHASPEEEVIDEPIESIESRINTSSPVLSKPGISPIQMPDPIETPDTAIMPDTIAETSLSDLQAIEEEKRRQRALRFGLHSSESPEVSIDVTIMRLDHALPNKSNRNQFFNRRHHRNHRKGSLKINKP